MSRSSRRRITSAGPRRSRWRSMPRGAAGRPMRWGMRAISRRAGLKQRQTMPFAVFEYVWKDEGRWSMVALPPDRLPATATEARYASAAVALEKSGQIRPAHTAYSTLLRRWPGSLAGQMGRGNTAYALKDFGTAESAFRQAAQDHTNTPAAYNNLRS